MADRTSTVRVNVVTDASSAGAGLSKFGRLAGVAALGVGAVAVGAAVGANKLYEYADAQDDANASITQGLKTMKLFGKQTDDVTKRIIDQAEATSKATGVDITSIKTTQAKLLTFKDLAKTADETGGAFDRATQAAIDMAAKGFGTAETNAVQLGKALSDPANGLTALKKTGALTADQIKTIGDEFKRTGDISKAQGQILAAVEAQVKGTAEATAGGFELMKNRVSLFAQELGAKLLPYLDRFGNFMIETGGPALAKFGAAIAENVIPKLQRFAGFIQERVIPVMDELVGWIQEHLVPAYRTVLAGALEGGTQAFNTIREAIRKNGPELQDMGDDLKKIGEFITDKVAPILADFYRNYLPTLGAAVGVAIGYLSSMYNTFQSIYNIIQSVINAASTAIQKLNELAGKRGEAVKGNDGSGRTSTGGLDGSLSSDLRGRGTTVINLPGGFVGDEVTLARTIKAILNADDVRYNLAGA